MANYKSERVAPTLLQAERIEWKNKRFVKLRYIFKHKCIKFNTASYTFIRAPHLIPNKFGNPDITTLFRKNQEDKFSTLCCSSSPQIAQIYNFRLIQRLSRKGSSSK